VSISISPAEIGQNALVAVSELWIPHREEYKGVDAHGASPIVVVDTRKATATAATPPTAFPILPTRRANDLV
jgi:hypothetical protein|tara:strand:+ start:1855 stop:2070 length:216 start_codon:yes stop_codon:yes gene_type:complete